MPARDQRFENLHGVRRRALAHLISDDPQLEVALRIALRAQARDVYEVLTLDVARRHDAVAMIDDAGRRFEQRREFGDRRIALGLEKNRFAMRVAHRHAHRRGRDV